MGGPGKITPDKFLSPLQGPPAPAAAAPSPVKAEPVKPDECVWVEMDGNTTLLAVYSWLQRTFSLTPDIVVLRDGAKLSDMKQTLSECNVSAKTMGRRRRKG
jgi:hypothetical protein